VAGVYSKRLWGPIDLTTTEKKLYTVPAGVKAVLKSLSWWQPGSTTRYVLAIGTTATNNNRFVNLTPAASGYQEIRVVMDEGEELWGLASTASPTNGIIMTCSGYELLLP